MKRRTLIVLTIAGCIVAAHTAAQEGRPAGCNLTAIGHAEVATTRDGRTLLLADGRELRLAGIEVTDASRAALAALAGHGPLRLARLGSDPSVDRDRYGRMVAFAYPGEALETLQLSLIEQGQARVSARIGDKACAAALLAAEKAARAAGRGLWADPNFAPLATDNLAGLTAARGHFALVEGKVLSVRESGATIYVNFGRRWTENLSVTILKRQQRTFAAAGLDLKKLTGRRIRVRGFIEQRRGPVIEATAPEQIELVD